MGANSLHSPDQPWAHLWSAGGVAADLGIGTIAILHRVLGLHQLLCFLNHLAPEPSDALSGREPGSEGPGAICSEHGLRVPPQLLPGAWTRASHSASLSLDFQLNNMGLLSCSLMVCRKELGPWPRALGAEEE